MTERERGDREDREGRGQQGQAEIGGPEGDQGVGGGGPRVRHLQVRILNLVHASKKGAFTL